MITTRIIICIAMFFGGILSTNAQPYSLSSPDQSITISIEVEDQLSYSVQKGDQLLIQSSPISMTFTDGTVLGKEMKVKKANETEVEEEIDVIIPEKNSVISDHYKQLELVMKGDYSLVFRAYNDGIAYRFVTEFDEEKMVKEEEVNIHLAGDWPMHIGEETAFYSHFEKTFISLTAGEFSNTRMASLPAVIHAPNDMKLAIMESDLVDYPGLFLQGSSGNKLQGLHPPVVLTERRVPSVDLDSMELPDSRNLYPDEVADYIAKVEGSRTYPWRVFMIAEDDAKLLENQLVYKLARPLELEDTDWIKPGKVAWDWLNANNVYGVDFKSGINTDTYKYYIDFAHKYGLEYIILDEGWSPTTDVTKVVPEIDMEGLTAYGKEKNVGIILWVVWKSLDEKLEEALDLYQQWGIKGIKVDFMQRDDQEMVQYYWKVAKEAAKRELLVDFHGSYKPSGMRRAYPNVITREGVKGGEWNKWSKDITPTHNVTIPFVRMLSGPIDYTPGLMDNVHPEEFIPRWHTPTSMGTRAHQMAMYVVFESPLQMLADNPSNYLAAPKETEFISKVPVVWDETRAIDAKIGQYIVIARRKGDVWYLGAMTNEKGRTLSISLDFLGDKDYQLVGYSDGINADRYAKDIKQETTSATKGDSLRMILEKGGGYIARLSPQ